MLARTSVGVVVLLIVSLAHWGARAAEPKRLIETGRGQRAWMTESEVNELIGKSHQAGRCGGFMDVTEHPDSHKLFVQPLLDLDGRVPRQQDTVHRLMPELSAKNIAEVVRHLSTSYPTRYYQAETGVQSQGWIAEQYRGQAKGRNDITVEQFGHSFKQPSVIARIQGTQRPDEIVVIGGHADSINWTGFGLNPDGAAPGADDDASGTSTVLEIFRVLAQSGFRPDRTIEFMAYAGEEKGLLGSQDIAQRYRQQNKKVVAVLQFDMTMYPSAKRDLVFISDQANGPLTRFTQMLADTYVKLPWREETCGYSCSDHASWDKAGYAAAFPFEAPMGEMNPKIHTPNDTLQLLDAEFGLQFAKLGLAFAVELSTGE